MSVLLKRGPPPSQPATKAAVNNTLQVVIDQKRGEEERKIEDGIAEGLLRERIGIREVDPQGIGEEKAAQSQCRGKIEPTTHANHERKQAHGKKNQRVEQHLQARVHLAVG